MKLSQHQELLIYYLKGFNLEEGAVVGISLMLAKSTWGIELFLLCCDEVKITKQEDFLKMALIVAKRIPPEERTGEVFDPPIRIKAKH